VLAVYHLRNCANRERVRDALGQRGREGLGQLTDPGGGDRDDGPRTRGDADGGIG
jgi:hypothetical protein